MNLLIKYASRGRPERFFDGLESIYNNMSDRDSFEILCALDSDDPTMNNADVIDKIESLPNISVKWGLSESKVHAINRDIPNHSWDILLVFSDDMRFTFYGIDHFIKSCFADSLDWHLCLPCQDEKGNIPVLYIAGRTFYDRFGFVYNPVYKSLFCDMEMMEIAKELGRYKFENIPGLFSHLLPAYGHLPADEMWTEQQRIGWTVDQKTYLERKATRLNNPQVLNDWFDAYKHDSL